MLNVLFWTWFILLHCISIILLYWWDQEKSEKVGLKVKYLKLVSDWERSEAELVRAKEKLEASKKPVEDPFKDWEEICLIDLNGENPSEFYTTMINDVVGREIVLPSTVRIKCDGHIYLTKEMSNGSRKFKMECLYYEGSRTTCYDSLKAFLSSQWKYFEPCKPYGISAVVRLYKKKEVQNE